MSSSIPGAVSNLITILTNALPSSVEVYFAANEGKFQAPQCLLITDVVADQQPAELGPSYRREESYAIHCCLVSFAGDQSSAAYQTRLQEVMALFATVETTIGNNPTLSSTTPPPAPPGGDIHSAVRFAELGTMDIVAKPAAMGGSTAQITFAVHCTQRITSLT